MEDISPSDDKQRILRNKCLARDGNQCVLTHCGDVEKTLPGPYRGAVLTQCAHIVPLVLGIREEMSPVAVS